MTLDDSIILVVRGFSPASISRAEALHYELAILS